MNKLCTYRVVFAICHCWKQNYTKICQTSARSDLHSVQSNNEVSLVRFRSHPHTDREQYTVRLPCYICSDLRGFFCIHSIAALASRKETQASGRVVHNGFHSGGSVQPQSPGDGRAGVAVNVCPQMWPAWYSALLACCTSAALLVVEIPLTSLA